jgi:hypothetical protein
MEYTMTKATELDTPIPTRRALLAGAPVAAAAALAGGTVANALAIGMTKAAEIDPIFAVIAEHQAAYVGVIAAYGREDREYDDDEITDAAHERAGDAGYDLFTTAPTTVAGVAALLGYLGTDDMAYNPKQTILEWSHGGNGEAVREFPTFLAAALRNIIERGQS